MTKIVYNACYGVFGLSGEGKKRYCELKGIVFDPENPIYDWDIERHDPFLSQVVEELGRAADGYCARLAIEEIEAGEQYRIDEYDGNESVSTRDSHDWKTA